MSQDKLIEHFIKNGKTDSWLNLAKQFDILPYATNKQRSDKVRKLYNKNYREDLREVKKISFISELNEFEQFLQWKKSKTVLSKKKLEPYLNGDPNNVLCISDIHIPFELPGALEFCRKQQEKFNCGKVI